MQTVLVTGAGGFVGHYLVKTLAAQGYRVVAAARRPEDLAGLEPLADCVVMDFTDRSRVASIFRQFLPQVIVHSGALSKPDDCEQQREEACRVNVKGTEIMLEAAKASGAAFHLLSTDFVFDGVKGMYSEEDERAPVNYYGFTKLLAEDRVFAYPGPWSVIRTVLVYGRPVGSRDNLLTMVAKRLQENQSLRIFKDQVRTPTYVEDLVTGIAAILHRKATGIFHLSGRDRLTPYDMALAVAGYLQLNSALLQPVTEADWQQPARRPLLTGFNLNKASSLLHYQPCSFEEGLRKTFGTAHLPPA